MTRPINTLFKTLLLAVVTAGTAGKAPAFSLLGPFKSWQVTAIGYDLPGDIGGPMTLSEGYRWNVPTIYYAFDQSFVAYFGSNGMAAVDQAMKVFNDLPKFSEITNDGSTLYIRGEPVPTDVKGPPNFGFQVAGLLDVKSHAMRLVTEELGLAEPTRYVWTIRGRNTETINGEVFTNYSIIKLNYDPITLQPSSYVNGVLYDYEVVEPIRLPGLTYGDAIERSPDPTAFYAYSAVADGFVGAGEYYLGLSYDDVGGLRALYNKNNFATENLLTGVIGGQRFRGRGSPWAPYFGITNFIAGSNTLVINTNTIIRTGLRPGMNKITFKRVNFDSLLGQVIRPVTNFYNDLVISNAQRVLQPVQRIVLQPDILFVAEDLGLINNLVPWLLRRTDTTIWQNNDAINGNAVQGGPGVISPQVRIMFTDQLPYFLNSLPDNPFGNDNNPSNGVWGSFDETTDVPIIYPAYLGLTLEDIQRLVQQQAP